MLALGLVMRVEVLARVGIVKAEHLLELLGAGRRRNGEAKSRDQRGQCELAKVLHACLLT